MNISAKINCPDCGKELNCNMTLSGKQVDQYYEDEHKKYIMLNEIYNKGMVSRWQVLKIISEVKREYKKEMKRAFNIDYKRDLFEIVWHYKQLQKTLIDKLGGER